jgi:hypothetical protein
MVSPAQRTESTTTTLAAAGAEGLAMEYGPKVEEQPVALVAVRLYTPAGTLLKSAVVPTDTFALLVQL